MEQRQQVAAQRSPVLPASPETQALAAAQQENWDKENAEAMMSGHEATRATRMGLGDGQPCGGRGSAVDDIGRSRVRQHEVKLLEQQSGRSLGGHGQRLLRCQEKAHPAPVHLHCSRKDALEPSPALIVLIDLLLDGRHWMTFACAGTLIVGCALRIVRAYLQEHGAAAATSSVSAAAHAPSSSGSATPGSNPKTGSPADQLPKPAPAEEGDKQTSSVKDSTPPSSNTVDTLKASGKDQDEAAAGAGDSETEFSSLTSTAGACESCLRTITIVQIAGTFAALALPSDFPAGALPADQLPFIPLTPLDRDQLALRLGEKIKASPMTEAGPYLPFA
ncbi:hypothetical protein BESB_029790 [Besnoitia besnoiti]|uniref:Uncharacterized protein n=1 Tax=Besnoitia besnoiti TaxID=94643 RepID=A0A2A9LZ95_BESBE|nr:hypothetical protein BESB_029790 [Besnoitia besnoiti]PFH31105.1 hypothetical protein BESB_029790 [Besnoitia besnoiti]